MKKLAYPMGAAWERATGLPAQLSENLEWDIAQTLGYIAEDVLYPVVDCLAETLDYPEQPWK